MGLRPWRPWAERSGIIPAVRVVSRTTATLLSAFSSLAAVALTAAPSLAQQAPVRPEPPPRATGAAAQPALPPLTADAQRLVDQWKQEHASIIEQLRFLQLTYRDSGHAEDAAAIAAQVRMLQQRIQMVSGNATVDLVNEGLPTRDMPVAMSLFRDRAGETLSFAIRGRDDQPVWGTTTYTDDSGLETAAVHAGLLRPGQSGIVKVRPLPGQERYEATSQNGVQSSAYAAAPGQLSFWRRVDRGAGAELISVLLPGPGRTLGHAAGRRHGDGQRLGLGRLHGRLLARGRRGARRGACRWVSFGFLKITIMPGQARYDGSPRNGVTSQSFGSFDGSFRVERAPEPWTVQLPGGEDASRLVQVERAAQPSGQQLHRAGRWRGDRIRLGHGRLHGRLVDRRGGGPRWSAQARRAGLLARHRRTGRGRAMPGRRRNGVRSQAYGPFEGTFRLERVTK